MAQSEPRCSLATHSLGQRTCAFEQGQDRASLIVLDDDVPNMWRYDSIPDPKANPVRSSRWGSPDTRRRAQLGPVARLLRRYRARAATGAIWRSAAGRRAAGRFYMWITVTDECRKGDRDHQSGCGLCIAGSGHKQLCMRLNALPQHMKWRHQHKKSDVAKWDWRWHDKELRRIDKTESKGVWSRVV